MRTLVLVLSLVAAPVYAQTATVAIFAGSAADPNTATPIAAPVTYTPVCGQPSGSESPAPISNPELGFYADPANGSLECRVNLAAQVAAIPAGTGYKGAMRLDSGAYGAFTTAFSVAAQPAHECDGTPPGGGTVNAGTRTLGWCHSGLDMNGNPANFTSWALYVDGARSTVAIGSVSVGATPNGAGLRLYSTSVTLAAGSRTLEVAGVNAVGEAARSPVFTATVTQPAAVPAPATIRSIGG